MFKFKKSLCVLLSVLMLLGVLLAAPINVSAGMPFYFHPGVAANADYSYWYAWTWAEGQDGYWLKGTQTSDGIEFFGLWDKVNFVLMYSDYETEEMNDSSWDDTIYQSDDLNVDYDHNHFTATKWTTYNNDWNHDNFNGVWADKETLLINPNTLAVSASTKSVKASKLKKAAVTVKPLSISKAKGVVKVSKVKSGTTSSIYSKVSVNAKTGALTFKKGTYKVGTYKVKLTITAAGNSSYSAKTLTKTATIKILGKSANTMEVTSQFKDVKLAALKKSNSTFKQISTKKAKGKVSYKKVKKGTTSSIYKYITVNKKNGAITFKKGSYKKGVYEVAVKVTAKGNDDYKSKSITATVKFRLADKFVTCKTCEGKGYVYTGYSITLYMYGVPYKTIYGTRTCTDCEGTGKVIG